MIAAAALVAAFTISPALASAEVVASPTEATAAAAPVAPEATAAATKAKFTLSTGNTYPYRGRRYVLPRTQITINGSVNADLDNQIVKVVVKKSGRTVKTDSVRLTTRGGKSSFSTKFRTGKKGKFIATVELTDEQKALATEGDDTAVTVVRTNIRRGSSGVAVRLFQSKLASLKYVVPVNGRFDAATGRAFMAFRKNSFMKRNETAGYRVARKLAEGKGGFKLRRKGNERRIEVSIKRQVMALVDNGKVQRVYTVSTGAPSTPTIRGRYHVYRKDWGTNAKGMVHSSYFIRGYAFHGYKSVPPYNASHGCVRIPIPNAASVFNWIKMGTRVDTYY